MSEPSLLQCLPSTTNNLWRTLAAQGGSWDFSSQAEETWATPCCGLHRLANGCCVVGSRLLLGF
eukprot:3099427-Amphidinium_carterae.1